MTEAPDERGRPPPAAMLADRPRFAPYVPHLVAGWSGAPTAVELAGSLVSLDVSGFTALSERFQTRGRLGVEELVGLISDVFGGLIAIGDRYRGDVLKFRGDALLLFYSGLGHAERALVATEEMQALIGETGATMSSVGPVALSMASGVYHGLCQFFLVDDGASHRLVVTGPAASETIHLESEASSGEILVSGSPVDTEGAGFGPRPSRSVRDPERYVPAALRAQLAVERADSEHRQVTAAFLNFRGVDAVLERGLDAVQGELEALSRLTGETCAELGLTWLESDIDHDGGKFLLVGGAPGSTGEDEERMLRALRQILSDHPGALELRAGVNRGIAFCGDIGSESRRTYTVMGDTVNLAARLTDRAEPGAILATGEVLDRARTRYATTSESFMIKGKARPVTGYSVGVELGRREGGTDDLPLVGREAELATLRAALTATRAGSQRVVEIVGEPGIGKSRLADALDEDAHGFTRLVSSCDPYSASSPYSAMRALLRPLAGLTGDLDEGAAGAQFARWVDAVMSELAPWLPLLAIPFGVEVPATPETDRIHPSFQRQRLHDAVERLLTAALVGPTLILVEDSHWADAASFELLLHLVRRPAPRPWLLCATRRPHGAALAGAVPGHQVIELERLSDEAAQLLTLRAAGELALSGDALAAVRERAGGNPLFMRELVGAARSVGSVEALPETVETVITARIDTLAPEDRLFLRNASVLGTRFELDVLAEVLAGELADVGDLARWDRLAEFVTWDGPGELGFRHELYRLVAYEGMSFRRRRVVHARVGDVLERRQSEPALLSLHFFAAGQFDKAWRYSTTAGDQAREAFANAVAAELYDRALASSEHLELAAKAVAGVSEALGDVADLLADFDRASAAFERARRLAGDSSRLLLKQGRVCEQKGLYEEAYQWIGRAAAVGDDEETRVELEIFRAGLLFRQGRFEDSVEVGKDAVEYAEETGNRAALAHALSVLDGSLTQVGRVDTALTERALALYEELDDLRGIGATLNHLGIHAYYAGRWNEALDFYRRSAVAKERSGDVEGSVMALHNEAEILSDQGHFHRSEALFQEALRIARAAGHRLIEAFVTANLGRLAARTGRFDEARALLEEAAATLTAIGSQSLGVETELRLAECLVFEGRHREAFQLAERTLRRAGELSRLGTLGPSLERTIGFALWQGNRRDESLAHFERSLQLARESNARYEIALTLQAVAETTGVPSPEAAALFELLGVVESPKVPLLEQGLRVSGRS